MKRRDFLKAGSFAGIASMTGFKSYGKKDFLSESSKEYFVETNSIPIVFKKGLSQVFIDWWFVEPGYGMPFWKSYQEKYGTLPWFSPYGVKLKVFKPEIEKNPIISDDPLGRIGAYTTLLYEKGLYRMWYEVYLKDTRQDEEAKLAYIESTDGKRWKRPKIGIFNIKGSKNNNLVYTGGNKKETKIIGYHGGTVFFDPTSKKDERYKIAYLGKSPKGSKLYDWLYGAVSPDGIHWRRLKKPILKYTSDSQTVSLYDEELKKYVIYVRGWSPQDQLGFGGRRIVRRSESDDFGNFPWPKDVLTPEPSWDPWTDIYTNAYHKLPNSEKAHIMMPSLYHRNLDRVEVYLALSRDGKRWFFPENQAWISLEQFPQIESIYVGHGIIPYKKGLWGFPVYLSQRSHNEFSKKKSGIYIAKIREYGFTGVEAELKGEFYTFPAIIEGEKLQINYKSLPGGQIRVELLEVKNRRESIPIKGFTLNDCSPLKEDSTNEVVNWKGKKNLGFLRGKPIRIRFELIRSTLFSFRFI